MRLSRSVTKVTPFSRLIAVFVLLVLILAGFRLGIMYQSSITPSLVSEPIQKSELVINVPVHVVSPRSDGWYRYMSKELDFYIDYPRNFSYSVTPSGEVTFEKISIVPHRTLSYVFVSKGKSDQFSKEMIGELKQMSIGEKKVIAKGESALPAKYNTYERLPDTSFGGTKIANYINKDVWEAGKDASFHLHIKQGNNDYLFGGLTSENDLSASVISVKEYNEIISTLNFLD